MSLATAFLSLLLTTSDTRTAGQEFDPISDIRFDQKLGATLPAKLSFTDDRGQERRLDELWTTRPVVFALVYYECPMLCDLVLEGMVKALKVLTLESGEDFDLRILSIDPGENIELAAAARAQFLERTQLADDDGVRFLIGDGDSIRQVAETVGFHYVHDPVTGEYAHAAGLIVTTPERVMSRYFYGIDFSPRDLRLGLVEASDGKVGSIVDQLLLLCLHYDPSTGQYGTVIIGGLRVAGVATVLVLGVSIFWMVRRDRRLRRA